MFPLSKAKYGSNEVKYLHGGTWDGDTIYTQIFVWLFSVFIFSWCLKGNLAHMGISLAFFGFVCVAHRWVVVATPGVG